MYVARSPQRSLKPEDVFNFIGLGWFHLVAFFLAGLTYFAYGCEVSFYIFTWKKFEEIWGPSPVEYAAIPSVALIPNILGAFTFGYLSDQYGRVWPYALALVICGVCGVASAFAPSYSILMVFRVLTGFGVGGIPVMIFPTLYEFLPFSMPAVLVLLFYTFGQCATSGLAWWLMQSYPIWGWRYLMILTSVPSFFAAVFRLVFNFESLNFYL